MRTRVYLSTGTALAVAVPLMLSVPAPASRAASCPASKQATYAERVPSPAKVLGFPIGARDVTADQAARYLRAVDRASPRVRVTQLARSHDGRGLLYAVVGRPERVRAAKRAAARLRDPSTPVRVARAVADRAPAILWIGGNVHGDEESGADAALRVLYQLADRTDCAAKAIRRSSVVALLPVQNPDGRKRDWRRNAYAFDLNRDWFARTQPETDGKVQALRRLPPVLFVDDHEMGSKRFFFPPNADPFYHEITDASITWINDIYGAAVARAFDRRDIPYFNRSIYDMFYMGYGDTVPTTGFIAAGMTYEKYEGNSTRKRVHQQYVAQWATLSAAARRKDAILGRWAAAYRTAYRQGVAGRLEPNEVINPGNDVIQQVPDRRVRSYFIRADAPGKAADARALVRRLQRMDVEVRELTAPLTVPRYVPYGREPRTATLPAGTYWISMAQPQKHWVQAMLNEDTYVPFPYFYDITAWSQPLLFNVPGGRTGAVVQPESKRLALRKQPRAPQPPAGAPRIGLFQMGPGVYSWESANWSRWLFEKKWRLRYRNISKDDIRAGALSKVDVLVTPNGTAPRAMTKLKPSGRKALRQWVRDGGRYIGWAGSTRLAARLGMSTVRMRAPKSDIPGSLLRLRVDPASPLSRGVGRHVWTMYEYDAVMNATDPSTVALSYPPVKSRDFFVSGFARGERELGRTAAVVDEPYGSGRTILFASEPNFRGYTDGMQQVLWNAIFEPDPVARRAEKPRLAQRRAASAAAAARVSDLSSAMVVSVRPGAGAAVRSVLARHDVAARAERVSAAKLRFVIRGIGSLEEDPAAGAVVRDLLPLGSAVLAVRVPSAGGR